MANAGDVIRACRNNAGLSQQALADIAGVPRNTLARYEAHIREPSARSFANLIRCCGCQLVIRQEDKEWEINF